MHISKKIRDIVFNKFGGKCSYCGCELSGTKWHVDHAEPVLRKMKYVGGEYYHAITGEPIKPASEITEEYAKDFMRNALRTKRRLVQDGFQNPDNHNIENLMPACASCNINKHAMNIEQFRQFIQRFVVSLNKSSTQYKIAKRYGLIQETGIQVQFYFETVNK